MQEALSNYNTSDTFRTESHLFLSSSRRGVPGWLTLEHKISCNQVRKRAGGGECKDPNQAQYNTSDTCRTEIAPFSVFVTSWRAWLVDFRKHKISCNQVRKRGSKELAKLLQKTSPALAAP